MKAESSFQSSGIGQKWINAAVTAIKRPSAVTFRLQLILNNGRFRRERVAWLQNLTRAPSAEIQRYVEEIEHDQEFLGEIRNAFSQRTRYLPLPTDFMMAPGGGSMFFPFVSLYALTRLVRPQFVVETGGTPGKSSAFILRAMQKNNVGKLFTLDLPPAEAVEGQRIRSDQVHNARPTGTAANWCVPASLLDGQTLVLGPAQDNLPRLLREIGEMDIFIHDSDHSYAHMSWEFETAFPYIRQDGLILSDDILANRAWGDFCEKQNLVNTTCGQMGGARKGDDASHSR